MYGLQPLLVVVWKVALDVKLSPQGCSLCEFFSQCCRSGSQPVKFNVSLILVVTFIFLLTSDCWIILVTVGLTQSPEQFRETTGIKVGSSLLEMMFVFLKQKLLCQFTVLRHAGHYFTGITEWELSDSSSARRNSPIPCWKRWAGICLLCGLIVWNVEKRRTHRHLNDWSYCTAMHDLTHHIIDTSHLFLMICHFESFLYHNSLPDFLSWQWADILCVTLKLI